jgi:hypothetical protein
MKTVLARHQPPLDHLLPVLKDMGVKTSAYLKAIVIDPLGCLVRDDLWKGQLDAGKIGLVELYMLKQLSA